MKQRLAERGVASEQACHVSPELVFDACTVQDLDVI